MLSILARMWLKLLFMLVLLAVVISLGTALLHLARDDDTHQRTVRDLTWRTLLSIVLFLLLLLAFALGLIRPHAPAFLHTPATASAYHQ